MAPDSATLGLLVLAAMGAAFGVAWIKGRNAQ